MTEIFNFNRIWLLLQRYFVENRQKEFYYWGFFAIWFMFFRNNTGAIGGAILVAGIVFCGRFFREIHSPTTGLNYFMIPATQAEKLVTSFLVTIFYYFGMMLVVYTIGNLVGTLLNNLFANISFLSSSLKWFSYAPLQWSLLERTSVNMNMLNYGARTTVDENMYVWTFFQTFIFIQAIFTLGSLYFKSSAVFKTILTLFVIAIAYGIVMGFGLNAFFGLSNGSLNANIKIAPKENSFNTVANIIWYLLVPYLWVLSYFKLTEKEV